jgi:hypothetical protein
MEVVRGLLAAGCSANEAARLSGVPIATAVRWASGKTAAFGPHPGVAPWRPTITAPAEYAYLLGLYLGDGCIFVGRPGVVVLRINLDAAYPGVVDACAAAMRATTPNVVRTRLVPGKSMFEVDCSWKRWVNVFPQHGPGRKHTRPIVLEAWQQKIVDAHPGPFVRGLIHSDGCRTVNRFTTKLPSGRVAEYAYPRYFFSNLSEDIRRLFCDACDALGVQRTQSNHRNISVSHRTSVAVLEELVGPKT